MTKLLRDAPVLCQQTEHWSGFTPVFQAIEILNGPTIKHHIESVYNVWYLRTSTDALEFLLSHPAQL